MARDPVVNHTDDQLQDGLAQVMGGDHLRPDDPLRAELLHLGLVRRDSTSDAVHITPDGLKLLSRRVP